jgi:hypothetical protein
VDAVGRIRLSDHANGLIGLLQLAKGTQQNWVHAAFGRSNRTNWICTKITALFSPGGTLGRFSSVTPNVLMWHLREAESVAKAHYQTQHSNDRLVASQEVIPQWAIEFMISLARQPVKLTIVHRWLQHKMNIGVWLEAWPADRRRLVFGMVLLIFEPKLQGTVVLRQCASKSLGMLMLKMCMRD